jgi:hypothetical protein
MNTQHPGFSTFLFEAQTRDGCAVVGGGIARAGGDTGRRELAESVAQLELRHAADPHELDYLLATHVCAHCAAGILVLGLSVRVPGFPGPAGGILGSPHRAIGSARGLAESIGDGFSVATRPGGPGIALAGTAGQARQLLSTAGAAEDGMDGLQRIGEAAVEAGIRLAVLVADGTGVPDAGGVMTLEGTHCACRSPRGVPAQPLGGGGAERPSHPFGRARTPITEHPGKWRSQRACAREVSGPPPGAFARGGAGGLADAVDPGVDGLGCIVAAEGEFGLQVDRLFDELHAAAAGQPRADGGVEIGNVLV